MAGVGGGQVALHAAFVVRQLAVRRRPDVGGLWVRVHVRRQQVAAPKHRPRHLRQGEAGFRHGLHPEPAVHQLDVVGRYLQQLGRDLLHLLFDPVRRAQDRARDRHAQTAAAGPEGGRRGQRVQGDDVHLRWLRAEVVGQHLRDHRVLALALQRETDAHGDLAAHVDVHRRALGHADAAHADDGVGVPVEDAGLDRGHDADAEVASLRERLGLLRAQRLVVADLEHLVQRRFVFPAVVLLSARDRVGELVRRDEVLAPDLRRVDTQAAGRDVHQLFEHEVVRRWPHPAIRALGELVRGDDRQVVLRCRDRVAADERGHRLRRRCRREAFGRGAEVIEQLHLEARDGAVRLDRDRRLVVAVPRLAAAGEQVLHAVFRPLHGASVRLPREHDRDVRAASPALAAEAAAVRLADEAHLV